MQHLLLKAIIAATVLAAGQLWKPPQQLPLLHCQLYWRY